MISTITYTMTTPNGKRCDVLAAETDTIQSLRKRHSFVCFDNMYVKNDHHRPLKSAIVYLTASKIYDYVTDHISWKEDLRQMRYYLRTNHNFV